MIDKETTASAVINMLRDLTIREINEDTDAENGNCLPVCYYCQFSDNSMDCRYLTADGDDCFCPDRHVLCDILGMTRTAADKYIEQRRKEIKWG